MLIVTSLTSRSPALDMKIPTTGTMKNIEPIKSAMSVGLMEWGADFCAGELPV